MQSLYPSFVPYQTQHLLLTKAQQLLEECCFDFAKRWLPGVVETNGWTCAAAVELTSWTSLLGSKHYAELPPGSFDLPMFTTALLGKEKYPLKDLFFQLHPLRNLAVHRGSTPAPHIRELLKPAVRLARVLRDHKRAAQLEELKSAFDSRVTAMEQQKQTLLIEASRGLRRIQVQKDKLKKQEDSLLAKVLRQDQRNKAAAGQLLNQAIGNIFGAQDVFPHQGNQFQNVNDHSMPDMLSEDDLYDWSGSEDTETLKQMRLRGDNLSDDGGLCAAPLPETAPSVEVNPEDPSQQTMDAMAINSENAPRDIESVRSSVLGMVDAAVTGSVDAEKSSEKAEKTEAMGENGMPDEPVLDAARFNHGSAFVKVTNPDAPPGETTSVEGVEGAEV